MIDELFINNRFGEKLDVLVRKPEGEAKYPTILLVSGIGADLHETRNSHDEIGQRLSDAGFTTIQFSFAGRGKSQGNYQDMTLSRQAEQLEDVIGWIKNQPTVDIDRIGIYAMSFGMTTSVSANLIGIKFLCLVGGAFNPRKSVQDLFCHNGEYHPDGISWRKFSSGETIRLKSGFWSDLDKFNLESQISKIKSPVFILHGGDDRKIPVSDAEKIFSLINRSGNKLKIVEGGDHGIIDVPRETREEFLKDIVDWFKKTL